MAQSPHKATTPQQHAVASYVTEPDLIQRAYRYITEGMTKHETCLIIVHLAAMKQLHHLLRQQPNSRGQYTILSATAVLEDAMRRGMPDRAKFMRIMQKIIDDNGVASRDMRIYGDMVAQLWASGNEVGAMALESLWNDLAKTRKFSLYCAYPANLFDGPGAPDSITHLHTIHRAL